MTIDLEIARAAKLKPIGEISSKVGIPDDAVLQHGHHIAKVSLDYCEKTAAKGGGKAKTRKKAPAKRKKPAAKTES